MTTAIEAPTPAPASAPDPAAAAHAGDQRLLQRVGTAIVRHYAPAIIGGLAGLLLTAITIGVAWGTMVAKVSAIETDTKGIHGSIAAVRLEHAQDIAALRAADEANNEVAVRVMGKLDRVICLLDSKTCLK